MNRPPLRAALARIRLGRGITSSQMAAALGLTPSQLSQIEHGRRMTLTPPDDIAAHLAEHGFASDPECRTAITAEPVPVPDGFAGRLVHTLSLTPAERGTLDAGLAGRPLKPPFPTDAEMERMRALMKGGPR